MSKRWYPWVLVGLLSFNFGVVYFDRMSLNFLMPMIQPELHLSNSQVGMLGSALSLSWALAGLGVGRVSDVLGRRKPILIICALVFSAASGLSGWATSFMTLLAARTLMGFAEGGVMPISQALIAAEVDPARRGLAMGVAQNFGANLLSNFSGPIVVISIALALGWRRAFYIVALPGLLAALLMWLLIREPPRAAAGVATAGDTPAGSAGMAGGAGPTGSAGAAGGAGPTGSAGVAGAAGSTRLGGLPGAVAPAALAVKLEDAAYVPSGGAWKNRNVLLCIALSILLVAFVVVFSIFMPLYLVNVRGLSQSTMAWLMSMFGLTSMAFAFLVPGSSDVLGRRPVVISMSLIGALIPLAALYVDQPLWAVFILFALGAAISGVFPLAMATIPSETVPPHQLATVLGLTMGLGEIIGGVLTPTIAGWAADVRGLGATLWMLIGLSAATGVLACFIRETAPRVLRRPLAATAG